MNMTQNKIQPGAGSALREIHVIIILILILIILVYLVHLDRFKVLLEIRNF